MSIVVAAAALSLDLMLRQHRSTIARVVDGWDAANLLDAKEADLVDQIASQYSIACPVLHQDQAELLPPTEQVEYRSGMFTGNRIPIRRIRIDLAVPFEGDGRVFKLVPSGCTWELPNCEASDRRIVISWLGDGVSPPPEAVEVRAWMDQVLTGIDRHLAAARQDIDRHNAAVRHIAVEEVARRRATLLNARKLHQNLGWPAKPQPAPESEPATGPAEAPAGEPGLASTLGPDEQCEEALGILTSSARAMERGRPETRQRAEEEIRDLLVIALSGRFQGCVFSEALNGAGKTDILIRVRDQNILVAECKIWGDKTGPGTVTRALDQMLNYLTWNDGRAGLLLFIRATNPTAVIAKAAKAITQHPSFLREDGTPAAGERYDYVFRRPRDPARQIRLSFLPFALPPGHS